MKTLRPYQKQGVENVLAQWKNNRSAILVMATGTGKTLCASSIIAERIKFSGRAIVIAHREELVEQAAQTIRQEIGCDVAIEMSSRKSIEDGFLRAQVVVASVQTLASKNRLQKFRPEQFSTIWMDEAHHATARTWQNIWDHFKVNEQARLFGTTATPDRGDAQALGKVFESVAFEYGMIQGINDGWLVPIKQAVIHVSGLDFSECRTTAGELNGADLASVMEYEATLHRMVYPTIEIAGKRRTLIFAASVLHSQRIAEIINRHKPGSAAHIDANTDSSDRRNILREFGSGKIQFLTNVGITTEGWDDPANDGFGVQVVAQMRPTKSRALYSQMAGRGTRPLPYTVDHLLTREERREAISASKKTNVLLLDFLGNSGRHRLVHASDVLGGSWTDETRQKATRLAQTMSQEVDILETLNTAERQIKLEQEAKTRNSIRATARFSLQTIDPFEFVGISPPKISGYRAKLPASIKQKAFLARNKVPNFDRLTLDQASAIIEKLMGHPSAGQVWFLRSRGLDPTNFTRKSASDLIGTLKNGR